MEKKVLCVAEEDVDVEEGVAISFFLAVTCAASGHARCLSFSSRWASGRAPYEKQAALLPGVVVVVGVEVRALRLSHRTFLRAIRRCSDRKSAGHVLGIL
jgi:hypothetical protein